MGRYAAESIPYSLETLVAILVENACFNIGGQVRFNIYEKARHDASPIFGFSLAVKKYFATFHYFGQGLSRQS